LFYGFIFVLPSIDLESGFLLWWVGNAIFIRMGTCGVAGLQFGITIDGQANVCSEW
jgi:hypothetical protein